MSGRQHWTAKSCCSCNVHLRSETWVILIVSLVKMSERGGYSCRLDACTLGVSQWIRGLLPVTSDIWMSQEQSEEFIHIRRIQCRAANHPPSWLRWFRNLIRISTRHLLGKVFWACPTKRRPWAKETSWLDGWMDGWISPFITNALPQWRCLGSYVHSTYFLTWFTANQT